MRSVGFNYLFFCCLIFTGCHSAYIKPVQRLPLTDAWSLSEVDSNGGTEMVTADAAVPGHVQQDLERMERIGSIQKWDTVAYDQWVQSTNATWSYETAITVTDEMLRYGNMDLVLDGIDTYASVFINDSLALESDNMFRQWRVAAKPYLKVGGNKLRVVCHPAQTKGLQRMQAYPYKLPAGDPIQPAVSPFVRKAPYQFGWDWSPRALTSGIWRPVKLELYDDVRISNAHISVKEINDSIAWMYARVELKSSARKTSLVLKVNDAFKEFQTNGRDTAVDLTFQVLQPKLWWPNGMGEQHQYLFKIHAYADGLLVDSCAVKTGIRTIRLVMEPDSIGTSFYFVVNDKPVFIQGANYVPQSLMPGSVKDIERLRLLKDAASVGMNMLRIWGGGVYESDRFYDLCDSLGLLVWQDFMFACAMYPTGEAFKQNVHQEAEYQVKRLANHAAIALWCGNNESDVAWKNWGWQKQYGINPDDSTAIIQGYQEIFQKSLPNTVEQYDPGKPYVHSSPLSNWGKRRNFDHLNMHYWGVWHGEESIDSFRVNVPRFMSEYGMQSLPSHQKLLAANGGQEIGLDAPMLSGIQKSYKGNRLLLQYIEDRYGSIQSTAEWCYTSQLHQSDAMAMAIEAHRMGTPKCMGTLYWQLNDVWDGASWSTIEPDGRWKAAHYELKRLYSESILSIQTADLRLSGQFQRHAPTDSVLQWNLQIKDFDGKVLRAINDTFSCKTAVPVDIFNLNLDTLLKGLDPTTHVWVAQVFQSQKLLATHQGCFVKPHAVKWKDPHVRIEQSTRQDGKISLQISVEAFAKQILLNSNDMNGSFSDNYFSLFPGETRTLIFTPSPKGGEEIKFEATSLYDYK